MKILLTLLCMIVVTVCGLFAQVPSYVPTNGLVGWWPFNGNAQDESGNGNHGTVFGTFNYKAIDGGRINCIELIGNNSNPTDANAGHFKFPNLASRVNNSISVNLWIRSLESQPLEYPFFSGMDNFGQNRIVFDYYNGFTIGNNNPLASVAYSFNTNINQWKMLTLTYSPGQLNAYINGQNVGSDNKTISSISITNGALNWHQWADGNVARGKSVYDDIAIYNRALTQSEITALYQASIPVTASASTISNVTCFNGTNGSARVEPGGGTGPYTYSWNTIPVQTTQTAIGLRAGTYTITVTDSKGSSTTANATITQPPALTNINASTVNDVSCYGANNGSMRVSNPAGGTPPYTYYWNTNPVQVTQTATNVIAGTYTVVVTDANGCNASSTTTVSQPAQPLSNVTGQTIKNVTCNGTATGIMTVTNPIGGTPPYSYTWYTSPVQTTQTAINVPAGTYSVKVNDANGCSLSSFATVTEPTKLSNITASVVKHIQCFGESNGSATVSDPRGGTQPYSYQWNTVPPQSTQTINNVKAGEYTVTVTDANGCFAQSLITITQPSAPLSVGAAKVEKNASCYGQTDGSISISNPTGGIAPYTITWNTNPVKYGNTISGLTAGTYTATITDAKGCTVTSSASISQPNQVVYTSPKDTVVLIQTKAEFTTTSNNPQSTFQWQTNTGTGYINLQNVFQFSGVETSILTVKDCSLLNNNQPFRCIISTNGCYDTTKAGILTIRTNVGIAEDNDTGLFIISPNPTGEAESIQVQCVLTHDQDIAIELVDILGKVHAQSLIPQGTESVIIPLNNLSSGMYLIRMKSGIGTYIEKLIVQ